MPTPKSLLELCKTCVHYDAVSKGCLYFRKTIVTKDVTYVKILPGFYVRSHDSFCGNSGKHFKLDTVTTFPARSN